MEAEKEVGGQRLGPRAVQPLCGLDRLQSAQSGLAVLQANRWMFLVMEGGGFDPAPVTGTTSEMGLAHAREATPVGSSPSVWMR